VLAAAQVLSTWATVTGVARLSRPGTDAATYTPRELNMSDKHKRHATGRTRVNTYEPKVFDEVPGGPSVKDIHVTETFSGDVEGDGVVHVVHCRTPRWLRELCRHRAGPGQHWREAGQFSPPAARHGRQQGNGE